jgi:hypothetical protein
MTEYNKEQSEKIARHYIASTTEIIDISDSPPHGLWVSLSSSEMWYFQCFQHGISSIGSYRLICIAKKTGKIVLDQMVGE